MPEETKEEAGRLASAGASLLPPPSPETTEAIASAVQRLRVEVEAATEASRRARLLDEAGEIQERGGDEQGAARDYLAAYNADTSFREPLEGLVRLLERRRSLANLGKLIDALVAAAATPEERARALVERATFAEDVQNDLEGARGAAREATESGAVPADIGPAWLTLELVAAKLGDRAEREAALVGRASLANLPSWRGWLLVDAAKLAAAAGETDRALELAVRAREDGGEASFAAAQVAEHVASADPGLPGSDEARKRARSHAEALEAQAERIERAIADAGEGRALGVPAAWRSVSRIVDLLVRASASRRSASELGRAAQALDRALDVLERTRRASDDGATGLGDEGGSETTMVNLERVVLGARLRVAELVGDTALAAELSERGAIGESDGGVVASLAMRVAEHAASEGDLERALSALERATERDPYCAPARALKIDILEGGPDAARFANELEELAARCGPEAKGRNMLLAAYVWTSRVGDVARARKATLAASEAGVAGDETARLGRSLASLLVRGPRAGGAAHEDAKAWYVDATEALLASEGPASPIGLERVILWLELAGSRRDAGDADGAAKAIAEVRALPDGLWLARVLEAFDSVGARAQEAARAAIEELAASASDAETRRALVMICAIRAHTAGDYAAAVEHLTTLAADDRSDPMVASFLGDMLRASGDRTRAARLAQAVAEATVDDGDRAGARWLEAGLELWRANERRPALAAIERAYEASPDAAAPVLAWAARGVDVDGPEGRRRAIDVAGSDAATALERFALEVTMGVPADASAALAALDHVDAPQIRLAGALARLAWSRGSADAEAVEGALAALAGTGAQGTTAAAAERVRLLRAEGSSPTDVAAAAKAWLDVGGGGPAAVEWLAAAMSTGDVAQEVPARRALAELLPDEAREALQASATLLESRFTSERSLDLVAGSSHAVRLANLELARPGTDPKRRASVLLDLDGALGDDAELDARGMAGWSLLASGQGVAALELFRTVTASRADDLHAWEGMRASAELLADHEAYAVACEQLGARCANATRGAAFWEQAALAWLKLGVAFEQRAEAALDASFARDATRDIAFDKLFRRVRDRKDGDKLLGIIARRLEVSEDAAEIAKLYWEQARALREKSDTDGALEALQHVVMFDENHVGALALTGEIYIRRGMFAEAAEKLGHLARVDAAPPKSRVTAGVAAVDLYENKLGRHDLALEVLVGLHQAKLTTLPVRERLARSAARTGAWDEATRILEVLMHERPEREGRIEAARLSMAIHRDRLLAPQGAVAAATKVLEESPADGEALDLLLGLEPSVPYRGALLERGRDALLMHLHDAPTDVDAHARLARVAEALHDMALEQAALSASLALGGPDGSSEQMIALLSSNKPRTPRVTLDAALVSQVLAPGDDGSLPELFAMLGPTLAEALGPTLESLGVSKKKDRVDPRAGLSLRSEIASWATCFGIYNFDLFVGGKDPFAVTGIPGETPAIVVGSQVNAPLSPLTRARLARELFAIARGTTVLRWRDDATVGAIVVASCNLAKVRVAPSEPLPSLAEVERLLGKAISRKTKAAIEPVCRALVEGGVDPRPWAPRARASQNRFAVIGCGDVGVVLGDMFGEAGPRLGDVMRDDTRAHELLRFVLSRPYLDVRRALGLEGDE